MRTHEEVGNQYAKLKIRLAEQYPYDIEGIVGAKKNLSEKQKQPHCKTIKCKTARMLWKKTKKISAVMAYTVK